MVKKKYVILIWLAVFLLSPGPSAAGPCVGGVACLLYKVSAAAAVVVACRVIVSRYVVKVFP